jgi:hypothetical protein
MEPQIVETVDLTSRERADLVRILRVYLEEKPQGEARETAERLYARLEPKARLHWSNER